MLRQRKCSVTKKIFSLSCEVRVLFAGAFCYGCEPKEPRETKITLKTEDLKNPFHYAFRIIKGEMHRTRDTKGEIYNVWESSLSMMIYDSVPNMTADRANEIASKWLDRLFRIDHDKHK